MRLGLLLLLVSTPLLAQKRAIAFDDYIALKSVSDPQLSPDGKWVAYTVSTPSLQDNRNVAHVWIAQVATGTSRQLPGGAGSDRQPRWSPDGKTLAFISTRAGGAQVWLVPVGGDARKISSLPDGASDPLWMPDGKGLIVTSDIKWPPSQEIDQRNGQYPTDARLWTSLMWRHWDDWRAGKRQHLFRVDVATGKATDLSPRDHDVPTIATSGDGDVAVSPDGRTVAFAMHADSLVADNTNVDIYLMRPDSSNIEPLTTNPGADNTPRYSPDGKFISYLSMERAGFEADRQRLMLLRRNGRTGSGSAIEATTGWNLSVGSYTWCPNSKCVYAVVEDRGRDNIYRIDLPSFRRSIVVSGGVNTGVQVGPDNRTLVYLHQSNTQPPEVWISGKALSHQTDSAVATLDLRPLEEFGFIGALGDSVFGWMQKPPAFDPARKYPVIYLIHGGPQGAWTDSWGPRWNNQMFAARGFVVAEVNFHGSTGYGQKFTDAISKHWGDYPFDDLMKGLDVVARLPYVDSTRIGIWGWSYGGFMTLNALTQAPDVYRMGIAVAPVTHWKYYDTIYTERYNGLPQDNAAGYDKGSPLTYAKNLRGRLLIVHGSGDDNVHFENTLAMVNAFVDANRPFSLMVYPNRNHGIYGGNTRQHLYTLLTKFVEDNLPATSALRAPLP